MKKGKIKIYNEKGEVFAEIPADDIETAHECAENYELPDSLEIARERLEEYRREHGEDPPEGYVLLDVGNVLDGDETYTPYLHLEDGRKGALIGSYFVLAPDGYDWFGCYRRYVFAPDADGEIEEKNEIRV